MDARPGGPFVKTSAQPGRAGDQSEDGVSAVGAALKLGPLPPMSLGANSRFPTTLLSPTATYAAFFKESRTKFTDATRPDRKSGGPAVRLDLKQRPYQ